MPLTPIGTFIILLLTAQTFLLPRQLAVFPILSAALWTPLGQSIEIAGYNFYFLRLVLLATLIRILLRREFPIGPITSIDAAVISWTAVFLVTSAFHRIEFFSTRLGMLYNFAMPYAVFRSLITSPTQCTQAFRLAVVAFIPVGVLLLTEFLTSRNLFSYLGGVDLLSVVREDKVRAQGPFAHAINAGIAGAIIVGFSLHLWRVARRVSILGILSGASAVFASSSSGPFAAAAIIITVTSLYRWRRHSRRFLWGLLGTIIALSFAMKAPVWFLIARIKVFGASTSYHRAALIDAAYEHLSEWWLAGTDYTRHWMAVSLENNPDFADITSEYVWMMVAGGILLLGAFLWILISSLRRVPLIASENEVHSEVTWHPFESWAITSVLCGLIVTCMTVSFFDQIKIFLLLIPAGVSASFSSLRRTGLRT